jgi:hypothetical protein
MQDWIAIAVAIVTAGWLTRSLVKRFFAAPCQPPAVPGGGDGFVPLESLTRTATPPKEASGRRSP